MPRRLTAPPPRSSFAGFRFPPEVIMLAVRWSPPARFPAVVLPMLSGYIALALQHVPSLIVRGFAVTATVYAGTLTTLAIFTTDGGFITGAAARPGLPPMFAAWTAATIGIAAGVGLLSWREQTRKSQGSSTA